MASPTVVVISASFGSGHDVAAAELVRRLGARGVETVRHDFVDLLGPRFGPLVRGAYAGQLRYAPASWGWMLRMLRGPRGVAVCTRVSDGRSRSRIADALAGADAVVSTYPLASLVLGAMRTSGQLRAPVATFLTDLSVHPMWISSGVDLHLAPHALAAAEARAAGAGATVVTAPAVDRQRFRPATDRAERDRLRHRFGLPVDERLALVSAGSWGVGAVSAIARDIAVTGHAMPVVACGRNDVLRRRLGEEGHGAVLGWTDAMPDLIRACDVMVTNAVGLTGLEAMASGLPVIAYRCLPGHGAANGHALHASGLGVRAADWDELAAYLADPAGLGRPGGIFAAPDPARCVLDIMPGARHLVGTP